MVSLIAHAAPGGVPLSDKEVFGFVCFLFIGGLDTVFATINNIWLSLAQNPAKVSERIADPVNINTQPEKRLRVGSVTFFGRVLIQDVELRGVQLKKDDRVTCVLPACNFNPDVFPNPREVNFHRPKKTTPGFHRRRAQLHGRAPGAARNEDRAAEMAAVHT